MRNKRNKKRTAKRIAIILAFILLPVGAFGFGYFFKDTSQDKQLSHTLTVDGNIISEDINVNSNGIVPGDSISVPISIKPNSIALIRSILSSFLTFFIK